MYEGIEHKPDEGLNPQAVGVPVSSNTHAIATAGEVFPDGSTIELIAGGSDGIPQLMLWDGQKETIGSHIEHHGKLYEAARIDGSVSRGLTLPTRCRHHGTTRDFLGEIFNLLANLVGLPEKPATLVARFVLCSAIVEAVSVAPALVIVGPDTDRGDRLVALLRSICWHSLPLTAVTPAGFHSLAGGPRFTYLISQSSMSDKLRVLLDSASRRDRKIPSRGRLLDLYGLQVLQSDSLIVGDSMLLRSIQISMTPTGQNLPAFGSDEQQRITDEFQAKLLSFRRVNLRAARNLQFDASRFSFELRDLARSMAAATPDDPELQAQVFDLLREEDVESRSRRWIDLSVIAVEAVLVACRESPGGVIYVSDLADNAQGLLEGRGEKLTIDPGVFGKQLKLLGFVTEPRDAKGKKLRLTEAVHNRAQQLTRDLGGPELKHDPQRIESQQVKEV
jgi:hypothetical protein